MNRADAEKQLWADYRRALRERDYDPLTPYHADLYPLANKLNAMLTDIQNRMTCALQIAQGIQGEEPRVEAVRNEGKWQGSVVELALTFDNNIRAVMNIGVSGIHSLFYYDSTLVTAKTTADTLAACDYNITALALQHLAWLRGEYQYLQKFLAERRAAQADLP